MGLIRLLIIALFIYLILRYIVPQVFGSFLPRIRPGRRPHQESKSDKLVACPACGTYNPSRQAYRANSNYFCNRECYANFHRHG